MKRVVALSTDKAAAPINLYGATKFALTSYLSLLALGEPVTEFSVVR